MSKNGKPASCVNLKYFIDAWMARANVDGAQLGACAARWDQYLVADGGVFPDGGGRTIASLDFVEAVPGWKSEWIRGVAARHHKMGGWMLRLTKEGELHSAGRLLSSIVASTRPFYGAILQRWSQWLRQSGRTSSCGML